MLGTAVTSRHQKRGQAMVESTLAMIVVLLVFLALFNLADLTRTKLLVENAAVKCARARSVGYNDFMLRKIARIATMPAAGRCLTPSDSGDGTLSRSMQYHRIGDYLSSEYETQADAILDFEHWQEGKTQVSASQEQSKTTATVSQQRPRLFDFGVFTGSARADSEGAAEISAMGSMEAHYPDYLQ